MLRADTGQKHISRRNMSRYPPRMDSPLRHIFRTCHGWARVIYGKINKNVNRRMRNPPYTLRAYHSRSNGQVKRINELMLQGIRVHCHNMSKWPQLLPAIKARCRMHRPRHRTVDSTQHNADTANKTKSTPELQIGQKVYKVKDVLGNAEDHKTAPKFERPYIIIDKAPHNVYKLQHFHTGKILRSHVHVDKLKSCASARETRARIHRSTAPTQTQTVAE